MLMPPRELAIERFEAALTLSGNPMEDNEIDMAIKITLRMALYNGFRFIVPMVYFGQYGVYG